MLGSTAGGATRSAGLRYNLRHGRPVFKGERRAREGMAVGRLGRDTNGCIVTDSRLVHWVVSQYRHDTVGGRAAIRAAKHAGARTT